MAFGFKGDDRVGIAEEDQRENEFLVYPDPSDQRRYARPGKNEVFIVEFLISPAFACNSAGFHIMTYVHMYNVIKQYFIE